MQRLHGTPALVSILYVHCLCPLSLSTVQCLLSCSVLSILLSVFFLTCAVDADRSTFQGYLYRSPTASITTTMPRARYPHLNVLLLEELLRGAHSLPSQPKPWSVFCTENLLRTVLNSGHSPKPSDSLPSPTATPYESGRIMSSFASLGLPHSQPGSSRPAISCLLRSSGTC